MIQVLLSIEKLELIPHRFLISNGSRLLTEKQNSKPEIWYTLGRKNSRRIRAPLCKGVWTDVPCMKITLQSLRDNVDSSLPATRSSVHQEYLHAG